jgi:chromate transporter
MDNNKKSNNDRLKEVALLFLKIGTTTFGGPAAHIAVMRNEIVQKREWISEQHFLDLIGATNLIPGPNSTEMAIHIGHERAGWKGLIIAGLCFILPAVIITGILALLYKQYGQLPQLRPFIYGIKPAIIAVILAAIYPLAKKSVKTVELGILGLLALILTLFGINEIYVMFGAGLLMMALSAVRNNQLNSIFNIFPLTFLNISGSGLYAISNLSIFLIFLKIGAILYGSGYVLFAFLDSELVAKGIISRQQLMDSIAVGQFTPGPLFSSVTFIGFQINYFTGAFLATIGIFLPSFLFVALLNPLVRRMRNSKMFSAFLDAVNVASISIIFVVCYQMGKDIISDWRTILLALTSLGIVFSFKKINSALVVIVGAALGYLLYLL